MLFRVRMSVGRTVEKSTYVHRYIIANTAKMAELYAIENINDANFRLYKLGRSKRYFFHSVERANYNQDFLSFLNI